MSSSATTECSIRWWKPLLEDFTSRRVRFRHSAPNNGRNGAPAKSIKVINARPTQLDAGCRVDIRDTNYVWCRALIYRTAWKWQESRIKFIFVTYDGKDKRFNE